MLAAPCSPCHSPAGAVLPAPWPALRITCGRRDGQAHAQRCLHPGVLAAAATAWLSRRLGRRRLHRRAARRWFSGLRRPCSTRPERTADAALEAPRAQQPVQRCAGLAGPALTGGRGQPRVACRGWGRRWRRRRCDHTRLLSGWRLPARAARQHVASVLGRHAQVAWCCGCVAAVGMATPTSVS